ncbi:hypothetical protein Pmani_032937 [Petrolisthes manimaculis]|uniref:Uncharacterized protein n=1 Tax=Petrolisthes manimaculis TaxID=1843537 RepID=A0AAE1NSJ6_9EUCA|nr:hypothetical protein Pmani_032937 [Petrolisthes manimaculis]
MMKPYFRSGTVGTVVEPESPAMVVGPTTEVVTEEEEWPQASPEVVTAEAWAGNRDATLREKLSHLTPDQQEELESNLSRFPEVFGDSPGLTGPKEIFHPQSNLNSPSRVMSSTTVTTPFIHWQPSTKFCYPVQ